MVVDDLIILRYDLFYKPILNSESLLKYPLSILNYVEVVDSRTVNLYFPEGWVFDRINIAIWISKP
jgi:hypothetical protein